MLYSATMSLDGFMAGLGRANVRLERLSLTYAPCAMNLWLRVVR